MEEKINKSQDIKMADGVSISLIIPVFNESQTIAGLINTIKNQSLQPAEIIIVDGASTDNTVELAKKETSHDSRYRIIEAGRRTMPGEGRNIGAKNTNCKWIAFTDAGIKLDPHWLKELAGVIVSNPETDIVYGNYSPVIKTWFDKIATLAFVPALKANSIRGKSVASVLLKKEVWEKAGGFPDFRAAEDLMFMDNIEKKGAVTGYAPKAMIYWQLRPTWLSTFRKFVLYSKHNVWAKRQWDWHYGILKQYLIALPFLFLMLFHSFWWMAGLILWLFARTAKRIFAHKYEFGTKALVNPFLFSGTSFLILTIDAATFVGWIAAYLEKNPHNKSKVHYMA